MSGESPITETDLHGYVDDRLEPERRRVVERYLAEQPDAAARLRGWQAGDERLRRALQGKLREAVPETLALPGLIARGQRRGRRVAMMRMAAAVVLALGVGAGSGWVARGPGSAAPGLVAMGQEAATVHGMFAGLSGSPTVFEASDPVKLASLATARLGRPVTPPDLQASGYRLLGGRMVATSQGFGCMFAYDGPGGRLTLFIRRMARDQDRPMRPVEAAAAAGFAWARGGLGFSLIGDPGTASLRALSNEVRDDLSGHA